MGGRGTPIEDCRIEGCLDVCSEARGVIGWCGCGTCVEGNEVGGCYTRGSDTLKDEGGCVGGFKSGCIAGCAASDDVVASTFSVLLLL